MTEKGKKRLNKGQFKKGSPGGPGRPKKPAAIDIDGLNFWDSTEAMIREALKSKDEGNRLKAVALSLKFQDLKSKADARGQAGDVIDPNVRAALGDAIETILAGDEIKLDEYGDYEPDA